MSSGNPGKRKEPVTYDGEGNKICADCHIPIGHQHFNSRRCPKCARCRLLAIVKGHAKRRYEADKPRWNAQSKKWHQENPEKSARSSRLWSRKAAGIIDPTDELRVGECEICHRHIKLVMEHDHATKLFRGWVCRKCNSGLGMFCDSLEILLSAVDYMKNANKSTSK